MTRDLDHSIEPPRLSSAEQASPLAGPVRVPVRTICQVVRQIAVEMIQLASDRVQARRDRRRATAHVRQIAMYVCHVALGLSQSEIGLAFGRDRTTVGHACAVVEDRRDDPAFDEFVAAVERLAVSVFGAAGAARDE